MTDGVHINLAFVTLIYTPSSAVQWADEGGYALADCVHRFAPRSIQDTRHARDLLVKHAIITGKKRDRPFLNTAITSIESEWERDSHLNKSGVNRPLAWLDSKRIVTLDGHFLGEVGGLAG